MNTEQTEIVYNKVQTNKGKIRLLFIVYDELRGKDEKVKLEESKLNYYKLRTLQKFKDEYLKETKTLS